MNILVTGGTGFVGSHVVRKLTKEGHSVFVVKNKSSDIWRLMHLRDKIQIIENDETEIEKVFKNQNIEFVFHIAARLRVEDEGLRNLLTLNNSNLNFGTKILYLCAKYNVKKFINTGTFYDQELCALKQDVFIPHNYYAVTKVLFEEVLKYFTYKYNMQSITLHLYTPYGEMDNDNKLIPTIINAFKTNKNLKINNIDQKLNFIYIDDVVDAYLHSFNKLMTIDVPFFEKFDIGDLKEYSISEIIVLMRKISGLKGNVESAGNNQDIHKFKNCNSSHTKKMLEWCSSVGLKDGLKKTWEYYLN